ncbi:MAG: DoxX family protein [Methylocella sp.]
MNRLILCAIAILEKLPYAVIGLLGRVAIGLVFWNSGRSKVDGWNLFHVNDKTLFLFQEEYKVPLLPAEFAAFMAQIAEHVFPILLFIGLATRFSALALFGMTLVIGIFVYPEAYVLHGAWAAVLLMLVKFGPGEISLDHLIARR